MRDLKIIWILGVFLLAAACQKRKYPEEKTQLEKESIYMNAYIGNEPVALKIGADGYYCYSSYKQTSDSVYVFEGELKKFDCNPCPLSLKLELSDYKKRLPGSSVEVNTVFGTGSRAFLPGVVKVHSIRFVSSSNKTISSLNWDLSDGSSFDDSIMVREFGQAGPQTISLTVQTTGNCKSTVVNKIFVDGASGIFACSVSSQLVQNNISKFKAEIVGGKGPFLYTWYFGDGITSNEAEPSHDFKWSGSYPVKLRIVDAENHVCESNYIHVAGNDQSSCTAKMALTYEGSRYAFFNGVKIRWTDQSNVVLSSDNIAQPAGSYFELVNSQEYAPNEKGEAGRLLTLRFNVLLSDGNRKLWFKSDNTAMVVAYK